MYNTMYCKLCNNMLSTTRRAPQRPDRAIKHELRYHHLCYQMRGRTLSFMLSYLVSYLVVYAIICEFDFHHLCYQMRSVMFMVTVQLSFLTACRKGIVFYFPFAARRPKLVFASPLTGPHRSEGIIALPQAVTINIPAWSPIPSAVSQVVSPEASN